MAGTKSEVDGAELMQVEVPGSPTELADASSSAGEEPKIEKRKREEVRGAKVRKGSGRDAREATIPDSDEELDSPSKRPSRGAEQPLSARELRELLQEHRRDMAEAWQTVENRLGRLEQLNRNQTGEMASLAGRTKVNEKDISTLKKTAEMAKKNLEKNEKKVEQLAEDVKNLKMKLEENKPPPDGAAVSDPWGEYLRQQHQSALPLPSGPWTPPSRRANGRGFGRSAGQPLLTPGKEAKGAMPNIKIREKFSLKKTNEPSSSGVDAGHAQSNH